MLIILVRQKASPKRDPKKFTKITSVGFGITTAVSFFSALIVSGTDLLQNEGLIYLGLGIAFVNGLGMYFMGLILWRKKIFPNSG